MEQLVEQLVYMSMALLELVNTRVEQQLVLGLLELLVVDLVVMVLGQRLSFELVKVPLNLVVGDRICLFFSLLQLLPATIFELGQV